MTCWDLPPSLDHQNTLRVAVALERLGSSRQEPENGGKEGRETWAGPSSVPCSLCTHDLEQEEHPGPWQIRAELGPGEKGWGLQQPQAGSDPAPLPEVTPQVLALQEWAASDSHHGFGIR